MFDLALLQDFDQALAALPPVPDLIRDLSWQPETPDQVRGGVAQERAEVEPA